MVLRIWKRVLDFQDRPYVLFRIPESRIHKLWLLWIWWNASEPSLAPAIIFQGVDSVGHAITVDSGQIRFEFMLLKNGHCMKTESTKSYNFVRNVFSKLQFVWANMWRNKGGYAKRTDVFVCVAGTHLWRTDLKRIRDYRSLLCKYIILRSLCRVSCGEDRNRYGYIPKELNVLFVEMALLSVLSAHEDIWGRNWDLSVPYCKFGWRWQLRRRTMDEVGGHTHFTDSVHHISTQESQLSLTSW